MDTRSAGPDLAEALLIRSDHALLASSPWAMPADEAPHQLSRELREDLVVGCRGGRCSAWAPSPQMLIEHDARLVRAGGCSIESICPQTCMSEERQLTVRASSSAAVPSWRSKLHESRGVTLVCASINSSKCRFISSCMAAESMSLASMPNGFSSSIAVTFSDQKTKTCRKVKRAPHHGVATYCATTTGVTIQCMSKRHSHIWA
mmetsp:Transcript_2536/g.8486  ORF Transcript_2536/g.8486 Transcript_2536/m.8486 type:complete len:204 (+) Transcript_2536:63-674(+)